MGDSGSSLRREEEGRWKEVGATAATIGAFEGETEMVEDRRGGLPSAVSGIAEAGGMETAKPPPLRIEESSKAAVGEEIVNEAPSESASPLS